MIGTIMDLSESTTQIVADFTNDFLLALLWAQELSEDLSAFFATLVCPCCLLRCSVLFLLINFISRIIILVLSTLYILLILRT
jgi:hypothetical protein